MDRAEQEDGVLGRTAIVYEVVVDNGDRVDRTFGLACTETDTVQQVGLMVLGLVAALRPDN